MSRPRYRLTELADGDIEHILIESARLFGPVQRDRYAVLVEKAIDLIVADPERPSSRERDDIAGGVRSFHVEIAAGRRGAAAHVLFYMRDPQKSADVLILRVLHEGMDPMRHIDVEGEP